MTDDTTKRRSGRKARPRWQEQFLVALMARDE